MKDRIHHAKKCLYYLLILLVCWVLGHLNALSKRFEQERGHCFIYVDDFAEKVIRSKHESVLFADFLNTLKCCLDGVQVRIGEILREFWKQIGPLNLEIASAHDGNHFEVQIGHFSLTTLLRVHHQINQLFLQKPSTLIID